MSRRSDLSAAPSAPPLPEAWDGDGEDPLPVSRSQASLTGGSVLIRPFAPPCPDSLLGDPELGQEDDTLVQQQQTSKQQAGKQQQQQQGWSGAAHPGGWRQPMQQPTPDSPPLCNRGCSTASPSPTKASPDVLLLPRRGSSTNTDLTAADSHAQLFPEASRRGVADETPAGREHSQGSGNSVTAFVTVSASSSDKAIAKPCRTAALRKRHAAQLRQHDKDQFGVHMPSTARPFSVWASPHKIGEACAGLGIHFASLKMFMVVALLLSVISIYPLVNDLQTQHWQDSYSLVLNQVNVASCTKTWSTHTWITSSTIGGHCASLDYNSAFDCAATCTASVDSLAAPLCAGQVWRDGGSNATQNCALHLPCNPEVTDPEAPHGPCHCCHLRLDEETVAANPDATAAQLWCFLLGQLVFLIWLIFLARQQLDAIHKVDARVITASDYAVLLTNLRPETTSDKLVQEWCRHYGPVAMAANIPSFGSALKVGNEVRRLQVRKAEADARLHEDCPPAPWLLRPWSWLYWRCVVGERRALQSKLDGALHKLEVYQRQEFEPTGAALAVFCYGEHATNCVLDHRRSGPRRLLGALPICGPALLSCCSGQAPKLGGATVTVTRAPEPSDFIWEHTAVTGARAVLRRMWSWTLTALVIFAGLGVQYALAATAEAERKNRVADQLLGIDETLDFTSWAAFTNSALQATRLRWISLLTGLVVVVVNWVITLVVRQLSVYERWHTRTSLERWTAVKLTLFYLTNSFAVPVLAAYLSSNTSSWYSRGGLMDNAFWTQVANALLPPLANLLDPLNFLYFHLLARFAKTQAMLDWLMAPPEFALAEQYASAVATLGMAVWYMPVLPISPMLAVVGLVLAYWADKWVALKRAAHPGNLNGQVTSAAVDVIVRLLPLVQLVLMDQLYFEDHGTMVPVFWTGLALWLLLSLAPLRLMLGLVRRLHSTSTGGLSYQETLSGGRRGGLDDAYMPQVPPVCSPTFREEVTTPFIPPDQPYPAIEEPMMFQKPHTAGPATRPPSLKASSALAPGTLRLLAPNGALSLERSYHFGAGVSGTFTVSIDDSGAGGVAVTPGVQRMAVGGEGPLASGSRQWASIAPSPQASGKSAAEAGGVPASRPGHAPRHSRGLSAVLEGLRWLWDPVEVTYHQNSTRHAVPVVLPQPPPHSAWGPEWGGLNETLSRRPAPAAPAAPAAASPGVVPTAQPLKAEGQAAPATAPAATTAAAAADASAAAGQRKGSAGGGQGPRRPWRPFR